MTSRTNNKNTTANDTANDRCFRTVKYNAEGKHDADTKVLHIKNPTDFKHYY